MIRFFPFLGNSCILFCALIVLAASIMTHKTTSYVLVQNQWSNLCEQSRSQLQHRRRLFLLMAGGGGKLNNKQAALRQKMELAKQQKLNSQQHTTSSSVELSDVQIRERNDRLRFEELLRKKSLVLDDDDISNSGYLTRRQEEDEIDAVRSGKDLLFEGDPAPTDCFEELVGMKTENAIGSSGKQRLVPWLHKNIARHDEYTVLLTDPRRQSIELREAIKILCADLPKPILSRLIIINADSPAENRRWIKKSGILSTNTIDAAVNVQPSTMEIYSDEKMELMRAYTALGEKRWSMTIFVIAMGRIQKLARNVDQYTISKTIQSAIQSYTDEMRLTIKTSK